MRESKLKFSCSARSAGDTFAQAAAHAIVKTAAQEQQQAACSVQIVDSQSRKTFTNVSVDVYGARLTAGLVQKPILLATDGSSSNQNAHAMPGTLFPRQNIAFHHMTILA